MKIMNWRLGFLLFFMGVLCVNSACAQNNHESARGFVQAFYDWYTPISLKDGPFPAINAALSDKRKLFSENLYIGLQEDAKARKASPDYIVGLDGDPFLNAQDPCERYEAGRVSRKDAFYQVEVYPVCDGEKQAKPAVLVELSRRDRDWVITNFYYPGLTDLLTELKLLKQGRQKSASH